MINNYMRILNNKCILVVLMVSFDDKIEDHS